MTRKNYVYDLFEFELQGKYNKHFSSSVTHFACRPGPRFQYQVK